MANKAEVTDEEVCALGDHIAKAAATIDAATHTLLSSIRRFDQIGGWHAQGAISCSQWLSAG